MTCARPGCDKDVVRKGGSYCSQLCSVLRHVPVKLVAVPDEYEMKCHQCGVLYDGRTGPWVGLCSLTCVGAYAMAHAA